MGLESITGNVSELVSIENLNMANLPLGLSETFAKLVFILQIAGIVFIVYVVFLLIRGILTWKRNKRIDITYEKILEIDKKLDELLKRTSKREKIADKTEKKPGFFARLFGKKDSRIKKIKK
jgi:hypothetical protein